MIETLHTIGSIASIIALINLFFIGANISERRCNHCHCKITSHHLDECKLHGKRRWICIECGNKSRNYVYYKENPDIHKNTKKHLTKIHIPFENKCCCDQAKRMKNNHLSDIEERLKYGTIKHKEAQRIKEKALSYNPLVQPHKWFPRVFIAERHIGEALAIKPGLPPYQPIPMNYPITVWYWVKSSLTDDMEKRFISKQKPRDTQ